MIRHLRYWLARKLCPEVFPEARRWHHLHTLVYDLRWWCSEFHDIAAAAEWLLACDAAYARKIGEQAPAAACHIDTFRERLRAKRRAMAAAG